MPADAGGETKLSEQCGAVHFTSHQPGQQGHYIHSSS